MKSTVSKTAGKQTEILTHLFWVLVHKFLGTMALWKLIIWLGFEGACWQMLKYANIYLVLGTCCTKMMLWNLSTRRGATKTHPSLLPLRFLEHTHCQIIPSKKTGHFGRKSISYLMTFEENHFLLELINSPQTDCGPRQSPGVSSLPGAWIKLTKGP